MADKSQQSISLFEIKLRFLDKIIPNFKLVSLYNQRQDISMLRQEACSPLNTQFSFSSKLSFFKPKLINLSQNSKSLINNEQRLTRNKFNIEKNFSLSSLHYFLDKYQRSNQDTCLTQRPIVHEGDWVQKGDLLADGTASVGGGIIFR